MFPDLGGITVFAGVPYLDGHHPDCRYCTLCSSSDRVIVSAGVPYFDGHHVDFRYCTMCRQTGRLSVAPQRVATPLPAVPPPPPGRPGLPALLMPIPEASAVLARYCGPNASPKERAKLISIITPQTERAKLMHTILAMADEKEDLPVDFAGIQRLTCVSTLLQLIFAVLQRRTVVAQQRMQSSSSTQR